MDRITRSCPGRPRVGGHFRTSRLAPFLVMVVILTLASCSSEYQPDEAKSEQTIKIMLGAADPTRVQSFSPNPLTVTAGTEIQWFNADADTHRIASVGGVFDASGPIPPGGQYRLIFSKKGNYRYYCTWKNFNFDPGENPDHREEGVLFVLP